MHGYIAQSNSHLKTAIICVWAQAVCEENVSDLWKIKRRFSYFSPSTILYRHIEFSNSVVCCECLNSV